MKNTVSKILLACSLAFAGAANADVVYNIQGGKLLSASGVVVNGEAYKVTFGDSCASMYSGCNSALFDFTTEAGAMSAIDALFGQVLVDNVWVDGIQYNFDSAPELVNSCDYAGFCEIWVPYLDLGNGNARSAWYVNRSSSDYLGSSTYDIFYEYGDTQNYMAFTNFEKLVAADVPEPTSLALIGVALAGLGLSRKRKAA